MSKKLEQIIRSSYTGCIDDREEVVKIVTKFLKMSLPEIINGVDVEIKDMIETMAGCMLSEEWDLSKELVESLNYTELLCLIDNTRIDFPEGEMDNRLGYYSINAKWPKPSFWYCGVSDVFVLLRAAEKANNTVKLFLSINVNTFFSYLKSIGNEEAVIGVWNRLKKRSDILNINIGKDTSIKSILEQAEKIRGVWNPWRPIKEYYNKILYIFDIYSCLLLDCFKYAYPEKFRLENIFKKFIK